MPTHEATRRAIGTYSSALTCLARGTTRRTRGWAGLCLWVV